MNGARVLRPLRPDPATGRVDPADRRIGETTDEDARRARADADAVAAWGAMEFSRCDAMGVITRAGNDGLHGFQYATIGACYQDWAEIAGVALRLKAQGEADYWTRGEA